MKQTPLVIVWVAVAVAVVSFFLPWVELTQSKAVKQLTQTAGGTRAGEEISKGIGKLFGAVNGVTSKVTGGKISLQATDIPKKISGFQVPKIANNKKSKLAMTIVEFLMGKSQNVGLKSYAVYLLPGIALLLGLLLTFVRGKFLINMGVAIVALAVGSIGLWKLSTVDTDALVLAVAIGSGLWFSLWAYVGLGIASAADGFLQRS